MISDSINSAKNLLIGALTESVAKGEFGIARALLSNIEGLASLIHTAPLEPDELTAKEAEYARAGQKIQAIKEVRSRPGFRWGLKEARDLVFAWGRKHGIQGY